MTHQADDSGIYAEARAGATTAPAALLAMPVSIAVSVGRIRTTIEDLMSIGPDSILELDTKIDDPVELIVGDRVVARGRLIGSTDGTGVSVEILDLVDG